MDHVLPNCGPSAVYHRIERVFERVLGRALVKSPTVPRAAPVLADHKDILRPALLIVTTARVTAR